MNCPRCGSPKTKTERKARKSTDIITQNCRDCGWHGIRMVEAKGKPRKHVFDNKT